MSYISEVFDVTKFGAVGDGSASDDAAIAAAIAALQAYSSGKTRGTLYFPEGTYKISAAITIALSGLFTCTIKGSGQFSSIILQSGSGANGIEATMTPTSTQAQCRIEICDLSLLTSSGVTAATAIEINYGNTATGSTEGVNGSVVTRVEINTNAYAGSGGWTNGIKFNNPWKAHIYDVSGCGAPSASSIPTSGAGSGAFIVISGGQNINITNINASFWQYGMKLAAGASGSAGLAGLTAVNFTFVAVGVGVSMLPQSFASSLVFSNFLIDQGNSNPNSGYANIGFSLDCTGNTSGGGQFIVTNGNILQVGGSTGCFEIKGPCTQGIISNVVDYSGSQFVHLYTGVTYFVFSDNQYGGGAITIDSGATNNQFNNIGGSTFSNSGGVTNTSLATLF